MEEMKNALLMHDKAKCSKVRAVVHSKQGHGLQDIWIANEQIGDNLYVALTDGKFCTAIYNFFTGCYYADDMYGIIEN